jgi:protein-disulfide isomerase
MKKLLALVALLGLTFLGALSCFGQRRADSLNKLRQDVEKLKLGQIEIQKQLQEVLTLLRGRQIPEPVDPRNSIFSIDGLPIKGDNKAKLIIVEFSDYQCPFCARYVRETLPQIESDYVKLGKVRYAFSAFPLEAIHSQALMAAEAALCAGEQGKYWEMHDQLFINQAALSPKELSLHAQLINLDAPKFQRCLFTDKYSEQVRKNVEQAQSVGVNGTPTFFIGLAIPGKPQIKVLQVMSGAQPYSNFKSVIDSLLSSQG